MFLILKIQLSHFGLKLSRSNYFRQKLIFRIVGMIFILYLICNVILVGYVLDLILRNEFPKIAPVKIINPFLFHLLFGLSFVQFFAQKLPFEDFMPWLALPVRKNKVVLSYLLRFLANPYIALLSMSILTFWAKSTLPSHNSAASLLWVAGFIMLSLSFNFATLLLKVHFYDRPALFVFLAAIISGVSIFGHYVDLEPIQTLSGYIFNALLDGHIIPELFIFAMLIVSFKIAHFTIRRRLYLDFR